MCNRWAIPLLATAWSLIAGGAFGVSGTTDKLQIYLTGVSEADCKKSEVSVVMEDSDATEKPADHDPNKACHWTLDTHGDRFNTNMIHFSLRVGELARTGCKTPEWDEKKSVAYINFGLLAPTQQITIMATPEMELPYARDLTGGNDCIPCVEIARLPREGLTPWTIRNVVFRSETVRLRFFESTKDVCGMLVNSLPAVKKAAKTSGGKIEMNRPEVVDALALQRIVSPRCSVPNLSSPAIDISEQNLRKRGLTNLRITVK
jgi:hypothetical protein